VKTAKKFVYFPASDIRGVSYQGT